MGRGEDPKLVRVTGCEELTVPTAWLPKVRLVGFRETWVPTPVRASVCGLPPSLSVTVTEPKRVPVTVGVNTALIVQLPPGARLDPQLLVCE